jgi:CHAT domain-containing protein
MTLPQKSEGRERRRLTLCPTGAFMQLPLHAAGIYSGNDQASCSEYFVASYTPSIAALLHAQQSVKPARRTQAETLLVAVDRPFQGRPLPMASKEANTVWRLVSSSAKIMQVSGCDEVLDRIRSATILHLACHGTQNPSNALQSNFHLEDGLLPVSRLMELELPSAFLAVLSACETAKGDSAQPDQAIHPAATMLFVGFKSIVATMWYVPSSCGRLITFLTVVRQVHGGCGRPGYRRGHLFGALQGCDVRIS